MNEVSENPKIAVYFYLSIFAFQNYQWLKRFKFPCFLIMVILGSLISFGTGTNLTWISPVLPKLRSNSTDPAINPIGRPITLSEASWIGSIFAIGGMFGPLAGGYANEIIGRKLTLITAVALVFLISFLILAFAKIATLYYLGRFSGGFAQGNYLAVMPIYLSEISETKTRGAVMTSTNILLACGSLYGFCLGPYVSPMWYSLLTGCWSIFFSIVFLFCPESPYYLVYKDQIERAEKSLMLLRSKTQSEANESLKLIQKTIENDKTNKVSVWSIFSSKGLRRTFIICFTLKTILQFSGFIAIQTYINLILQLSESEINPNISAMITAGMRIVAGIVTILTIDRCGRKVLVYVSTFGVIVANFSMGCFFVLKDNKYNIDNLNWIPNVSLLVMISMIYLGLVPISLIMLGELFPSPYKSAAGVVFVIHGWLLGFLVSKLFLVLGEDLGFGPVFFFFSFCCLLGEVWVCFFMIETKGKTFLEIQEMLNN